MSFQSYFKAELDALREEAQRFAAHVPELAAQLLEPGNDPDVERLLEGVAYLIAGYRFKNDEHATQIAHHVAERLMPQVLTTRPAATIVEFIPKLKALSHPHRVAKGTDLKCLPVDGTSCRFTTCQDTFLWPLEITEVSLTWRELSYPRVTIKFFLGKHGARSLVTAATTPLQLFVWKPGDLGVSDTASTLIYWLTMQLGAMLVERDGVVSKLRDGKVALVDPIEFGVMPWPQTVSPSLRCIVEYFYVPERFHFIELHGLENAGIGDEEELVVHFDMNRVPQTKLDVSKDCFRLHCSPALNLFCAPSEPFRLMPSQHRALIRADEINPEHMEVYQVQSVESAGRNAEKIPHFSKREPHTECAYFLHREESKRDDGVDTYFSVEFVDPARARPLALSLDLLCTNRELPLKLRVGDVQGASKKSLYTGYRNLTRVVPPVSMALGSEALWQLVSHLSTGARLPTSASELQALLRLYEFSSKGSVGYLTNQRVIDAVVGVELKQAPWVYLGATIHSLKVTVTVDETPFPTLGRAYIFGTMLDLVYRNLTPLNTVVGFCLKLQGTSNQEIRWPVSLS